MTGSEQHRIPAGETHEAGDELGLSDKERQRRIAALRALSGEPAPAPMTPPVDTGTSRLARGRRCAGVRHILLLTLIVLAIGGAVAGYLLLTRPPSQARQQQRKPGAIATIDLSASKLFCARIFAWSPDGRQIGVIGYDIRCRQPNSSGTPEQFLGVFDVATGKPSRILELKDVLAQTQLTGEVSAISWSKDGKTVLLFGTRSPLSRDDITREALILYAPADQRAAPRVIFGPPVNIYRDSQAQVWDLSTPAAGPVIAPGLAPALSYRWTADGRIVADQPFPAAATATTRGTSRDGSFTFWQPGILSPASVQDGRLTANYSRPTAVFFSSQAPVWSPDGRYVTFGLYIGGPVAYSTPSMAALPCSGPFSPVSIVCPIHPLPAPDRAFTTVVRAVQQGETVSSPDGSVRTSWHDVSLSWRADGKYLTTILPGDEEYAGKATTTVTFFDTTTGSPIKQVNVAGRIAGADRGSGPAVPVLWSPTGTEIALLQPSADAIAVLNVRGLLP